VADAKTPSSTKRKTASRSSNGSSQKSGSGSTKSGSGSTRARSAASRSTRAASSSAPASANGSSPKAAVITGVATAAAGVAGGVILGRHLGQRPRHVLGVRVPGSGAAMGDLVKQVKRSGKHLKTAGKQIADLTDEVRSAREKAEEIGRAIS
jgi:hypothetical protein